jgi:multicomponent Na+:H+ antiporter subunit E
MSRLTLGAILVAVWLLLWGSITVANVLSGIAVAAFLFAVYPSDLPWRPSGRVRPGPFLVLCGRFVVDVVWSNVWLTIAVLGPQRSVHTELVRVELRVGDPRLIAMVTNLTALTPGAMVVRVDAEGARPVVLVHVLSVRDPDRFASAMLGLERRCVRALGSDEQVALVERAEVGR